MTLKLILSSAAHNSVMLAVRNILNSWIHLQKCLMITSYDSKYSHPLIDFVFLFNLRLFLPK